MIVLQKNGGIASTNSFLIADDETKEAVIFDAPDHTVGPLLNEAQKRGWKVIGLWLTHGHFDHVADHPEVIARFPDAKVFIHRLDEPKLRRPNSTMFMLPFSIQPRAADGYFEDGQKVHIGKLEATVIHTPGHSPGHVMFHFPNQQVLVGGDLIIMGAVGRTDLPDSDHAALNASIRKIIKLPPETRLLPGHGQPSTLGEEMQNNPFVQEAMEDTPQE
jgi:glyoxylase-like metal-dependent hydrolase (beta-lactamase superfamily II)